MCGLITTDRKVLETKNKLVVSRNFKEGKETMTGNNSFGDDENVLDP